MLDRARGIAGDGADDGDVEAFEQTRGRFEPRAGIVIARGQDDLQCGQSGVGAGEEIEKAALCGGGWIDRVENIPRDEERIGPALGERAQEPVEKKPVLEVAIIAVKGLAQMPVGGVKKAEHRGRISAGKKERERPTRRGFRTAASPRATAR